MLQTERRGWERQAAIKNGGNLFEGVMESDPFGSVSRDALDFSFVRCLGCGCLYDPWVKERARIERANIQHLKDFVQHPLEQLAECAEGSDDSSNADH
jgi:hypothetical protein